MTKRNWGPKLRSNMYENSNRVNLQSKPFPLTHPQLVFPSCIGLAAGLDKDGIAISQFMDMGFGFVEIGSVTPLPQPGNPKPRLYRLSDDCGIINRFGFNSMGLDVVESHVKTFRQGQSPKSTTSTEGYSSPFLNKIIANIQNIIANDTSQSTTKPSLLGINLGKNKLSQEPLKDYERGILQLGPYADYLVINISSPNTPGLRDLQRKEPLRQLLQKVVSVRNTLDKNGTPPPILVKIAPDLSLEDMEDVASVIIGCGIDGILISNTTNERPDSLVSSDKNEGGGLSGAPLKQKSTECIRQMYKLTNGSIPIIGIGGVGSGQDAYDKLKAGASLVQIYSMMIYKGPGLVSQIRKELAEIMYTNGEKTLDDVVGKDHEQIYWNKRLLQQTKRNKTSQ